jgi:hypothetical protein
MLPYTYTYRGSLEERWRLKHSPTARASMGSPTGVAVPKLCVNSTIPLLPDIITYRGPQKNVFSSYRDQPFGKYL